MKTKQTWLKLALLVVFAAAVGSGWLSREGPHSEQSARISADARDATSDRSADIAGLPAEAMHTLRLIEAGGPFPYDRDGTVFQNREGHLPSKPRGYYREYTVETPGSSDRGARRIVSGGEPPTEYFYTDDHYRSFRRIEAATQ